MIFIYTLVLWLLLPYIFLRLLWRARKQPEYLYHVAERFGFYSIRSENPVIWLHAVSVGETRATQNLVTQLQAAYPKHQILLSHATPTGRATSKQLYGDRVLRVYLPYDYPFAVNKFLRHFRPQLGILMETEIWFNLIQACHLTNIPLLLLNARMSEKSALGYARFEQLTRNALSKFASVAAQTKDDAIRLTRLGATNISVIGNLKFDIEPPNDFLDLSNRLRRQLGDTRPILLAASTRDGEEALLLNNLNQISIPDLLLVIVPRHPQRFTEVSNLIQQQGFTFQRRSDNCSVAIETKVVLGDSMGEMFAYYAAADLTFIGGSLLPYGGQNLIEACAVGTPVLVGPYMHNFAEATKLAVLAGAAIQIPDINGLVTEALRLFQDASKLHDMGQQCFAFVARNRGATEKSLQLVKQHLKP